MVTKVVSLSSAQEARMAEHAARWIEAGFATGPADRCRFEEAARRCYVYAGIPWPGNVVWVSSPLTLTLVVLLVQSRQHGAYAATRKLLERNVRRSMGKAAWDEIEQALLQTRSGCAEGDQVNACSSYRPYRLMPWAEGSEVSRALVSSVRDAPANELQLNFGAWGTVHPNVQHALREGMQRVVENACRNIGATVDTAVQSAVQALCSGPEGARAPAVDYALAEILELTHFILKGPLDPFASAHRRALPRFALHPSNLSFLREVCALELKDGAWDKGYAYDETMYAAGWWYPHSHFVIVCERPEQIHRELGRQGAQQLHHDSGPAISWPGGWSVHAFHGCQVPSWVIEHPDAITVANIKQMQNVEVRRVMIQRYGLERFINHCGATVVDSVPMDHPIRGLRGARLLRMDLPGEIEPVIYLDMINSTPEPDGTYKHYFERIRPSAYGGDAARLCIAAMASRWFYRDEYGDLQPTFLHWEDYVPDAES